MELPDTTPMLEQAFEIPTESTVGQVAATAIPPSSADRPVVDRLLLACPSYYARYPSETIWQRLRVMTNLGAVHLVPYLATPPNVIPPPEGVSVLEPPSRVPLALAPFIYPARLRAYAENLQRQGGRALIWARPDYFSRRAARTAADATGWPLVLDVWDVPDLSMRNHVHDGRYLKALIHRLMQRGLAGDLERANLIVWSLHREAMYRYFQPEEEKVLHLPNGVQWSALRKARSNSLAHRDVRSNRPLRLLYMGHFLANRGSGLLSDVLNLLSGRLDVALDVIGTLSPAAAQNAVASIPPSIRKKIHFHGHVPWDEAMELLGRSHVCLYAFPKYPELEYIYPLKLLEYAAMDKWIISSDLLGARELLRDYPRVVFCDPASAPDWAEAICSIASAPRAPAAPEKTTHPLERNDWDHLNHRLFLRVKDLLDS